MTRILPRTLHGLAAALAVACTSPAGVIVAPDAAPPRPPSDAGTPVPPTAAHCEPAEGASWTSLGNPLSAAPLLDLTADVVAMHDGVIVAGGRGVLYATEEGAWTELPWTGLPEGAVSAIAWHDGAWVVAIDANLRVEDGVFRLDASGAWSSLGAPPVRNTASAVIQLVSIAGRLLAHTQSTELFALDEASGDWVKIEIGDAVMDLVSTDAAAYASSRISHAETIVYRSTDGEVWEAIPAEVGTPGAADLVAGPGFVLVVDRFATPGAAGPMLRLDESEGASAMLRAEGAPSRVPVWIAEDGTVLSVDGTELWAADSLEAEPRLVPGIRPFTSGTGAARILSAASEGSAIVLPATVDGGMRIVRSDDRAASFRSAATADRPATILELASDDRELLLRVRDDTGAARTFRLEEGAWIDVSGAIPDPSMDGITGIPGWFVTRTAEYAQTAPFRSSDGGRTWERLAAGFPSYLTNAGPALRRVSAYAEDGEGRLYAGTIGGWTQVCCTGQELPLERRTGAGIWRLGAIGWAPLNAGVPIEAGPDPLGGPPFRSDVHALASTGAGVFASLVGRGVYRLVADRWHPHAFGLPLDVAPELVAVGETALAWWPEGMAVLEGGVWAPRGGGPIAAVTARADLLVRATDDGLSWSNDLGVTWSPLPPLDGVVGLAVTRDRLYARTGAQAVHALPIACTEGSP